MKKTPLALLCTLAIMLTFAQSPQGLNYQAVVRNSAGVIVPDGTPVKLKFTIHDGTAIGTPVYTETVNDTTNQFGLVNTVIGTNGNLATVSWGNGAKFLQVELQVNNAATFTDMGTTQLLSVPYALYAANSNAGPQGPTGNAGQNGLTGPTGDVGPTGTQGDVGPTGPAGDVGATGPQGSIGNTGPQGDPGIQGSAGSTGPQGDIGPTGPQGPIGLTGAQGDPGIQGNAGPIGNTGPQGDPGIQGSAGTTGPQGDVGPTGPQGIPGNSASLPSGVIVMWSGALANIPAGWLLCDGTNGTPNLLDRFIASVPNAVTNPGTTGGANTYNLSVAQLPAHDHSGSGTTSADGSHTHTLPGYHLFGTGSIPFYNWSNNTYSQSTNTTSADGNHTHTYSFTTSQTGSGAAIDNRPAYYTLAFIIKQ